MKLQYLAVIFLIIVLPIIMVLSQYIDYQIDAINLKYAYNTKLLDSTYDALKAYQLNTVNNAISDISAEKIENLEAAVKTFFNSLTTNFNYTGYNSSVMKEYVPAVVFAMYDGYYIYSPYRNVLTGVPSEQEDGTPYIDKDYSKNDEISEGIKSYVYYSCRYKKATGSDEYDVVITYTLDNYITIQGYATVDEDNDGMEEYTYINKSGYLVDGITKDGDKYKYDGVEFTTGTTECLKETLGNKQYYYAKLNGTKYYLDGDSVFYINATGEKAIQASKNKNEEVFKEYKKFIEENNSAYRYYKEAYEFTSFVHKYFGELTVANAVDFNKDGNSVPISEILGDDSYFDTQPIFGEDATIPIQDANSSFNAHRSAIIRYTINKNLKPAITGFKEYSKAENAEFLMPEISETDWETIQNNVSIITFLQGFNIAGRDYNEYCVVANNLTKEYVDENDIYILDKNGMYYKPNDTSLNDGEIAISLGYKPGIWKINFERRNYQYENDDNNYQTYYYYPIKYLGSYSSIVNSTSVDTTYIDLYNYMRNEEGSRLKTTYYTALGRERYGQYSVNKDIDIKPSE